MYFYHEHYHDAYAATLEDLPSVDQRKEDGAYEPLPTIVNWLLINSVTLLVIVAAIHASSRGPKMTHTNRRMRLTEAHVALLPARIDDPGPTWLDGEKERPDSYYSATAAALIDAIAPDGEM